MYKKYSMMTGFESIYTGKANETVPVYKYISKETGLKVVIAQVEGPLVNGFFCLATEAHDDDGLPHTLEHLIFLGSEQYPYKGVLDIAANRCLASGTNAWTDTDHTCYTTTHAGSTGFLNLLPIYLDHILYPTITDSGYLTEVYHINAEGEDAGVVYCEMQTCENTGENLCHREMLRELYPGKCGYKSETGGAMKNLRESTSHQKVKDYHTKYYQPENLTLIITGKIEPEETLQAIQNYEKRILSKGARPAYERPWESPVPNLPESVEKVIQYPNDDEDVGMVYHAWRGPLAQDQYGLTACSVLMEYLCDTVVAPLHRDMVEIDKPFCNKVCSSIIENSESCLYLSFNNVPVDLLKETKQKMMSTLGKLGCGDEKLDMKRMTDLIHKKTLELASALEDRPHSTLAFIIIGDALYGKDNDELHIRLNQTGTFNKLATETEGFWLDLLNNYLVKSNSVTIIGEPSKSLMEKMGEEEKKRIAARREEFGEDGLKQLGENLQKAIENNEVPTPEEMLLAVEVPSLASIHFHEVKPSCNHSNGVTPSKLHAPSPSTGFPLADIPVPFQLDDIQTNFATSTVIMNTSSVTSELKPYMQLFLEMLDESPVMRDGELVSHEMIVKQLAAETVHFGASVGLGGGRFFCGTFADMACVEVKVELDKYQKGIQWLKELLLHTEFTVERVKMVATKMVNDVARLKRRDRSVIKTLVAGMMFNKESNHHTLSMLRQHKFLSTILEKLADPEEAKKVLADLGSLRQTLTNPSNITIHHAVHVETLLQKVTNPHLLWKTGLWDNLTDVNLSRPVLQADSAFLQPFSGGPGKICGVGAVESAFMSVSAPSISSHDHPDLAPLMVYIQYLTQLEGPMWKQIRGMGLAYHYTLGVRPEAGLITLNLFMATHVVNAYKEAKGIIQATLENGDLPTVEFESGKSSLVFELIEEEKTPAHASKQGLLAYCRGVGYDRSKELIKKIDMVTKDDLMRIGSKYLSPLFDDQTSKVSLVCNPSKVEEITADLKELGRELVVMESLESSFLAEP